MLVTVIVRDRWVYLDRLVTVLLSYERWIPG